MSPSTVNKKDRFQVRISSEEKELIRKIKNIDPNFNVSLFFRSSLKEYGDKVLRGVGVFRIG